MNSQRTNPAKKSSDFGVKVGFGRSLLLAFFSLGAMSSGFASENQLSITQSLLARPNRIYFGPEFLSFHVNSHIRDVHIDSHRSFWGMRFGYEYLKPQSFYAAAEILATNASRDFSVSNETLVYNGRGGARFGNIQARFGYTLSSNRPLITPFLSLGVYALSKRGHNGFKESMGYLSGGLRTQFECTSACLIALNAEIFRTLGVQQSITIGSEKATNHTNGWGCNVGVPLTLRLSPGCGICNSPLIS
jgi:hypothetical protein